MHSSLDKKKIKKEENFFHAIGKIFTGLAECFIHIGNGWHKLINWIAKPINVEVHKYFSIGILLFAFGSLFAFAPIKYDDFFVSDVKVERVYYDASVAESYIFSYFNHNDSFKDSVARILRYDQKPEIKSMYKYIELAEKISGIDRAQIFAIISTESDFDPTRISPTGCRGLMQLAQSYHKGHKAQAAKICNNGQKKDYVWTSPCENIVAGSLVFREYLDESDGDPIKAHLMYHDGPNSKLLNLIGDKNGLMIFYHVPDIKEYDAFKHLMRVMRRVIAYRMYKQFGEVEKLETEEQLTKFRKNIGIHKVLVAYK